MSFSTTAVRSVAVPGLLLLLALAAALTIGAKSLPIGTVFTAFSGTCHAYRATRACRALWPVCWPASASPADADAHPQPAGRPPRAGVNSGASFAIVLGAALFDHFPAGAAAGVLRRALRLAAGSLYRQPGRRSAEPGAPHSHSASPAR